MKKIYHIAIYFLILFLLMLGILCWFGWYGQAALGWEGFLLLATQAIANAVIYMLPSCALLLAACLCKSRKASFGCLTAAAVFAWLTHLLLFIDGGIRVRYGYHINGLVLNIFLTPGGFRSMGLDAATMAPIIIGLAIFLFLHLALAWHVWRAAWAGALGSRLVSRRKVAAVCAIWLCVFLISLGISAFGTFYGTVDVLSRLDAYPIVITMRMNKFLTKIGLKQPDLRNTPTLNSKGRKLRYPAGDIQRKTERKPVNVIWLVAESLRADFLNEEIMPHLCDYAANAIRFERHYSSGHGTRPAMFGMFYGLNGLNWNAFLNNRRAPVLMDWLQEDNYQFLCQTSSDFTYPEFNQTLFVSLPNEVLREQKKGESWEHDQQLVTDMLEFIRKRDDSRGFFAFGFFEATHAPYRFPESAVIRQDYMDKINYATVTAKDAERLRARSANAAHFLDLQFQRVFEFLAANPDVAASTIVIVTGDHGEEFYEKGRLGHNSTFVEEQIRVPLVMALPGQAPKAVSMMTNHSDILPTIAPYLGVTSPAKDYCIGQDMMSADYHRECYLISGWETAAMIDQEFKCVLPFGRKGGYFQRDPTKLDDSPCTEEDIARFKGAFARRLALVQEELSRFTR